MQIVANIGDEASAAGVEFAGLQRWTIHVRRSLRLSVGANASARWPIC